MTSVPRDPAFWKRFSLAVHLDEEKGISPTTAPESRPKLKHTDSWLEQQHAKKRRNRYRLCLSALAFAVVIVAIVLVVVFLTHNESFTGRSGAGGITQPPS